LTVADDITCGVCGDLAREGFAIVGVDFVFQGKIPLMVVCLRCPLCGHEWTVAHEPLNRPSLPNDAIDMGEK
jgi:hypothetical protein